MSIVIDELPAVVFVFEAVLQVTKLKTANLGTVSDRKFGNRRQSVACMIVLVDI